MPKGACWDVETPITIQGKTGITIHGNGATFYQRHSPVDSYSPVFQFYQDTNVSLSNATVIGAYDGTNNDEAQYGVVFEADNGITLNHDSFANIAGDFIYAAPPNDVPSQSLNQNITIENSVFNTGGYHGLTLESVNGFTFTGNLIYNVFIDAIDMEYDDFSSGINSDGSAFQAGQDNINISNNVWNGWGGSDWFVSDQGQTPGVQAQHVILASNTLNGNGPFMEVVGTDPGLTTQPYLDYDWAVVDNKYGPGFAAAPYRGGGAPASSIFSVVNLVFEGNTIPVSPAGIYAFELYKVSGFLINNNFSGALGVVQPEPYDNQLQNLTVANNQIG